MFLSDCEVKDVGIDYFTGTASAGSEAVEYLIRADTLLSQERRTGFFLHPWRMSGYDGWKCGRLQFGQRPDGAVVRLSSELAARHWWQFWQLSGRCTRIDLQVTLYAGPHVQKYVRTIRRKVLTHFKGRRDGPVVTLWSNSEGGCTVYIGKRSSALYFRGYDKGAQSGDPKLKGHLRLELEVKDRLCESIIATLVSADYVAAGIAGVVAGYLRARGVPTAIPFIDCRWYQRPPIATDCLKSLQWLREAVRPTIARLLEQGMDHELADALGLQQFANGGPINRKDGPMV